MAFDGIKAIRLASMTNLYSCSTALDKIVRIWSNDPGDYHSIPQFSNFTGLKLQPVNPKLNDEYPLLSIRDRSLRSGAHENCIDIRCKIFLMENQLIE